VIQHVHTGIAVFTDLNRCDLPGYGSNLTGAQDVLVTFTLLKMPGNFSDYPFNAASLTSDSIVYCIPKETHENPSAWGLHLCIFVAHHVFVTSENIVELQMRRRDPAVFTPFAATSLEVIAPNRD
jgi:hypothetical protein